MVQKGNEVEAEDKGKDRGNARYGGRVQERVRTWALTPEGSGVGTMQ